MARTASKAAGDKKGAAAPRTRKKAPAEPSSRGLTPEQVGASDAAPPAEIAALEAAVAEDGAVVLARYREPLGGAWTLLAALPIDQVEPTPFQRDVSKTHVE